MATRDLGSVQLTPRVKYDKYKKYPEEPEEVECEECEECEECADSTCEPCDECSPEGTFCEGDGFATCSECQEAWCQCQSDIETLDCSYIPLGEPEFEGPAPITVLENEVHVIAIAENGFRKRFKIKPACFTVTTRIDIVPIPATGFQLAKIYIKWGSPASSGNFDFEYWFPPTPGAPFSVAIDNVENQTLYIALDPTGLLTLEFEIWATLNNDPPLFENCAECCIAFTNCDESLTECETNLIDCDNEVTILTSDLLECRADLENCTYDDNFMFYWSGGAALGSAGGSPCIPLLSWSFPIGDIEGIYNNPNLCSPLAMCDLHNNLCYCYPIYNTTGACNIIANIGIPNCGGTTVQSKQVLYITTVSRTDFFSDETFNYSELTNFAGPGDVFVEIPACQYDNVSGGLYQRTRFFYLNEGVWTMPSLLDAVITFSSEVRFGSGGSAFDILREIVLHINQP